MTPRTIAELSADAYMAYFTPMLAAGFSIGEAMALLYHKRNFHPGYPADDFKAYAESMIALRQTVLQHAP